MPSSRDRQAVEQTRRIHIEIRWDRDATTLANINGHHKRMWR